MQTASPTLPAGTAPAVAAGTGPVVARPLAPAEAAHLDRLRTWLHDDGVDAHDPEALDARWARLLATHAADAPAPAGVTAAVGIAVGDLLVRGVPGAVWMMCPGPEGATPGVVAGGRVDVPVLAVLDAHARWRLRTPAWTVDYVQRATAHLVAVGAAAAAVPAPVGPAHAPDAAPPEAAGPDAGAQPTARAAEPSDGASDAPADDTPTAPAGRHAAPPPAPTGWEPVHLPAATSPLLPGRGRRAAQPPAAPAAPAPLPSGADRSDAPPPAPDRPVPAAADGLEGSPVTQPADVEPVAVEPVAVDTVDSDTVGSEPVPADAVDPEPVPVEADLGEPGPSEADLAEPVPAEPAPADAVPAEPVPAAPVTSEPALVRDDAATPSPLDAPLDSPVDTPTDALPEAEVVTSSTPVVVPTSTLTPDDLPHRPSPRVQDIALRALEHGLEQALADPRGVAAFVLVQDDDGFHVTAFAHGPAGVAEAREHARRCRRSAAAVGWTSPVDDVRPFPRVVIDASAAGEPGMRVAHAFVHDAAGAREVGGPEVVGQAAPVL